MITKEEFSELLEILMAVLLVSDSDKQAKLKLKERIWELDDKIRSQKNGLDNKHDTLFSPEPNENFLEGYEDYKGMW